MKNENLSNSNDENKDIKSSASNENGSQKLTKKQEIINLIKFVLFSASAGIIQVVAFTLLNEFVFTFEKGNEYGWSYFIALVLSVLWNFTFNRKFTFKSANNIPIAMALVFAYYCVFTPLSIWWGNALTSISWNEYLVLILTMIINMATEFLWTRFVVYRNSINTAKSNKNSSNKINNDNNSLQENNGKINCEIQSTTKANTTENTTQNTIENTTKNTTKK